MSSGNGSTVVPSSAFQTTFYNDSSDNLSQTSQLSPGVRPGSGRTGNTSDSPEVGFFNDERRPSLASVTTASSSGSKSSMSRTGGFHKKLQGFFGEDFTGKESSEASLPLQESRKEHRAPSYTRQRERNHSHSNSRRDQSPASLSRPRTPVPSSDVVPFLYQDSQVSRHFDRLYSQIRLLSYKWILCFFRLYRGRERPQNLCTRNCPVLPVFFAM